MKQFIVFNGSPAGKNSNTHVIGSAFLEGAKSAAAQTETVFLAEQDLGHCKGCFACWFKTPGECVMKDDMEALLTKYNNSDLVCFASPVYTWNMTALLKNFVDRLTPLKSPLLVNTGGNFDLADTKAKTQQFMVISNCGFPGDNNFDTMKAVFAPCNPVLEIYRNCGRLLKSQDEKIKALVGRYLQAVTQAGWEMATAGQVTEETKAKLELPLMSASDYGTYLGM